MEGAEESTTRSSGEITTPPTINLTQNQPAIFFNLSLDDLTIRCFGYYKLISESIEYPERSTNHHHHHHRCRAASNRNRRN